MSDLIMAVDPGRFKCCLSVSAFDTGSGEPDHRHRPGEAARRKRINNG